MKEVRYLYIDNLVEVDLENIEIYAGLNKVEFIISKTKLSNIF